MLKSKGMLKHFTKIIILTLTFAVFASGGFLTTLNTQAQTTDEIIINEIAWMGTTISTADEWIELYNKSTHDINLSGWILQAADGTPNIPLTGTLPAGGYFLLERTDDNSVPNITADQIYSGDLGNSGEVLNLKNSSGLIIDSADGGNDWAIGGNKDTKQTLERKNDTTWATSLAIGGTPKSKNSVVENDPPPSPNPIITPPPINNTTSQAGEIVINEFVSDPADGEEEWVEIYNKSSRTLDLSNCQIQDGSGTTTSLNNTINPSQFIIIKSPKGNLNNSGDIIILKCSGNIIDQVSYGEWSDGATSNNAKAATDPQSVGRLPDGADTGYDKNDFTILNPTPAQPNQPSIQTINNAAPENNKTDLVFSEIYANPPLSDEVNEFIELYNSGNSSFNLSGWILSNDYSIYIIRTPTEIPPQKYLTLFRNQTQIALSNNRTEHLLLTSPDGKTKIKLNAEAPEKEGISLIKNDKNDWQFTLTPTPNATNKLTPINQPPRIEIDAPKEGELGQIIVFDASDTIDPEKDTLTYKWNFDDGIQSQLITPSHIFTSAKKFSVKLSVTDSAGNSVNKNFTITIKNSENGLVAGLTSTPLELTEIIPNPEGSDNYEWIEIYNPTDIVASTLGFQILINSNKTKLPNYEVPPESYIIIPKSTGHFNLPNNGATIQLISPSNTNQSPIIYGAAKQGQSFARNNNRWQWSALPTPGAENIILSDQTEAGEIVNTTLSELNNLDDGTLVQTEGIVTSLPDQISAKIIYLTDQEFGVPLNLSRGNWPTLKLGNKINAIGTYKKLTSGHRLIIKNNGYLKIINSGVVPTPNNFNISDLTNEQDGSLITTSGIISDLNKKSFYITDNQNQKLKIAWRSDNLKLPDLNLGLNISATGFVVPTKTSPYLLLRSADDIIILLNTTASETNGSANQIIDLSNTNSVKNFNWLKYLIPLIFISLILYWLKIKNKFANLLLWWNNLIRRELENDIEKK